MNLPNYYEFLQISPNAEAETVHRVYRFLAVRLHPDNPETGDTEKFILLQKAYEVLSNPERRAEYDQDCQAGLTQPAPMSESIDFMDSLEGELNRRLAVLALLYMRRRKDPDHPAVSLFEIEKRMGFPREYLEFTLWYLQRKLYISRADNADFVLLAEGVDFVEAQRPSMPVLNKLLTTTTALNSGSNTASRRAQAYPIITPMPNERRGKSDRRKRPLELRAPSAAEATNAEKVETTH